LKAQLKKLRRFLSTYRKNTTLTQLGQHKTRDRAKTLYRSGLLYNLYRHILISNSKKI
jgi:hypothetical protein